MGCPSFLNQLIVPDWSAPIAPVIPDFDQVEPDRYWWSMITVAILRRIVVAADLIQPAWPSSASLSGRPGHPWTREAAGC